MSVPLDVVEASYLPLGQVFERSHDASMSRLELSTPGRVSVWLCALPHSFTYAPLRTAATKKRAAGARPPRRRAKSAASTRIPNPFLIRSAASFRPRVALTTAQHRRRYAEISRVGSEGAQGPPRLSLQIHNERGGRGVRLRRLSRPPHDDSPEDAWRARVAVIHRHNGSVAGGSWPCAHRRRHQR